MNPEPSPLFLALAALCIAALIVSQVREQRRKRPEREDLERRVVAGMVRKYGHGKWEVRR